MAGPTDLEQLELEYVNDARLDPLGDAARYILSYSPLQSQNSAIDSALRFFKVDGNLLLSQFSALVPTQPVAWNDSLAAAARQHNSAMIAADSQEHVLSGELGLAARIEAAGYIGGTIFGENIFAFAQSDLHAQAGFMVDWGNGPGGMQTPAGHRNNIMNPSFREAGIGILSESNPSTSVGPLVVTEDLAARPNSGALILGSAYNDLDHDNFYSAGEGLGSLVVSAAGATVTSWASGGFTLNTQATGLQTVTFSGAGLSGPVSATISLSATSNVLFHVVNGNTLETSTSAIVSGPVTTVQGLGTVGLVLSAGDGTGRTMIGAKGNDTIQGGAGNDTLVGGAGNDILNGGPAADTLNGALGFDVADYGLEAVAGGGSAVSVDLLSGFARDGFGSYDTLIGIEGVVGSEAGDLLYGTNSADVLSGGGGDDQIVAWDGADYLNGGAGNDVILGWTGADTLFGGDGNDWLWAGDGNDIAEGGAGDDVLVGDLPGSTESGDDTLTGGLGSDILLGGSGNDLLIGGLDRSDGSDPGCQGLVGRRRGQRHADRQWRRRRDMGAARLGRERRRHGVRRRRQRSDPDRTRRRRD